MDNGFDPIRTISGLPESVLTFIAATLLSSFAGLARILGSGGKVPIISIISATMSSGTLGLVMSLLWYKYFKDQDNSYFLIGLCGLAGLGGTTAIDFMVAMWKSGGISVKFPSPPQASKKGEDNDSVK